MKDLPARWQRKPLEDVAEVILGQSPPGASYNESGEGIPFFQGKAEFGVLYPTVRKWTTEPKTLANKDDVLISVRAPVGPTNLAPLDCSVGRGLAAIRPLDGMPTKYLLYALRVSVDALASQATGTTFAAVSGRQLRAHEIVVAPADEQQHLVEAIEEQFSRLDAGVDSMRRSIARASTLRQAILCAAFTGGFTRRIQSGVGGVSDLPPGWIRTTLGELGHYWNGRGFKKHEWRETGRPIIRIQNLTGSGSTFNYFQGEVDERYIARPGDLLVSWAATLGVFEWKGPEAVVNQHIFKVDSFINRRFHRYLLEYVLDDLQAKTHGSGMVHITRKRFDETPVQVPESLDEQQRIVETIEEEFSRLDAGIESMKRSIARASTLRQAILRATFTGRLVFGRSVLEVADA